MSKPLRECIIPRPKRLEESSPVCRLSSNAPVDIRSDDARIERAVLEWRTTLPGSPSLPGQGLRPRISCAVDERIIRDRDGYRVRIRPDLAEIIGGSTAGCFHGLQTIRQLSRIEHASAVLPCCVVEDWPDFQTRGLLHDVTRGKVPTPATLKLLVDRLASLKVNQLQLYIEHAFAFTFDPEICGLDEGLDPNEIRELDAYCRDRFIDLVPALATFGHMGRILSMPKYSHLAEIEAETTWEKTTWPKRARGLTLDSTNTEGHALIARMWSEVLDAFSSPVVNICGDEPWDLGLGRSRIACREHGKGRLYVDHLLRTHGICSSRGRRTQAWSDVVRNHPELLGGLPQDMTILHWGYDELADYEGTSTFAEAGVDVHVCPGTSGWKRVLNAMNKAERNTGTFARAGLKHGAKGLLNTDWGDHGHFNPLAASWHAICLGAALGWDADHPTGRDFDDLFTRTLLGFGDAELVSNLRATSQLGDCLETWPLLYTPLANLSLDLTVPGFDRLRASDLAATDVQHRLDRIRSAVPVQNCGTADLEELYLACAFTKLCVEKLFHLDKKRTSKASSAETRQDRRTWAEQLDLAAGSYAECWLARNKAGGLADILSALHGAAADARGEMA